MSYLIFGVPSEQFDARGLYRQSNFKDWTALRNVPQDSLFIIGKGTKLVDEIVACGGACPKLLRRCHGCEHKNNISAKLHTITVEYFYVEAK